MIRFIHRLRYFVADAWDEWRHSKGVNLLALGTLTSALFLAGVALLVIGNVDRRIQTLRGDVRVEIYLADGHVPEQRKAIQDELRAIEAVARVEFVDKDEALRRYQVWASGLPELIEDLETNPLPESLEVYFEPEAMTRENPASIEARVGRLPAVEDVRFGDEWLERLESMLGVARVGGSGLAVIILIAVVVVMASVLRLAVYSRREEIDIMRLVGATPSFIRGPFLVAGAAQGVIASVLALVLLEGVRRAVLSYSGTGARVLIDLFAAHPLPRGLAVVLLVVGLLVSMAGSYFAVRESV
jgi:cell division transport system permease protein